MTELNFRHLSLAIEIIEKYRFNHTTYTKLVNRLEELLFSLDSPPQEWITQVADKWEHLETINALILDSANPQEQQSIFSSKIDTLLDELTVLLRVFPET